MDPMMMFMLGMGIFQVLLAMQQRAAAKTPEEQKTADELIAKRWLDAEAILTPLAPDWRERLAAYRAGQDPYGTGPKAPPA